MIDYRYLSAFSAVASTGSFTEAGKKLRVATSAVSRQIQLLEQSCGNQLFFRSSREAKLTDVGARLFEELRYFSGQVGHVLSDKSTGVIRIGSLQGILRHWLIPIVTKHPFFRNLNVDITVKKNEDLLQEIQNGHIDIAFFSEMHNIHIPSSMQVYRLFREDIVLISSKPVSLDAVKDHRWISFSKETWLTKFCKSDPHSYITVDNMDSVVDLVRQGAGISMIPLHALHDKRGLHVTPVLKFSKHYIYAITRHYDREPIILGSLLEVIREFSPQWKPVRLTGGRSS